MPEMHSARRMRAQRQISELGADAALVTSGVNVRYLTGLVSSNAAVLVAREGPSVLCTDSRYAGTAERECADLELVIQRDVAAALVERALASGLRVIAFEDRDLTVQRHRALTGLDGEDVVG